MAQGIEGAPGLINRAEGSFIFPCRLLFLASEMARVPYPSFCRHTEAQGGDALVAVVRRNGQSSARAQLPPCLGPQPLLPGRPLFSGRKGSCFRCGLFQQGACLPCCHQRSGYHWGGTLPLFTP